ncbi:MAG: D-alanine--D-alanine ligase [Planctomycetota bacterium]
MAVIFGGYWEEREVSVESARTMIPALQADSDAGPGLEVIPVRWDFDGWTVLGSDADLLDPGVAGHPLEVLADLRRTGLGVVFNALHGGPGEDGSLQGLLEVSGTPYTGASVHASAVSMNKETFRERVKALGYEVAAGGVIHRNDWLATPNEILTAVSVEVGLPAVVKPVASGSSCGIHLCKDTESLTRALDDALGRDRSVLVEQFISGREVSIPCLGTRVGVPPEVLPIVEIESLNESGFFDYEAKYDATQARETVPASLDPELQRHLEDLAVAVHEDLELGGVSRTDVIIGADGPVVLETQTVPGYTAESLLPKCAAAAGIDLTALGRRLIDYALSAYLSRGAEALPAGSEE